MAGSRLETVIPEIEDLTGATLKTAILADCRLLPDHATPPGVLPVLRVLEKAAGQKRSRHAKGIVKRPVGDETQRSAVEPWSSWTHQKRLQSNGSQSTSPTPNGDAINPILAAAG